MSYKSPIEIWCDDFVHNIAMQIRENNEMQITAQINQHVSVDKEELIKALNYDRQQYEKGYADAKAEYQRPQGEWLLLRTNYEDSGNNFYECTNCHYRDIHADLVEVPYCWHCGAKMKTLENN